MIRDNLRNRREIEQAYLTAIHNARSEILIANAYFLPGVRFRRALVAAAQRGVQVTLLLQGRVEYVLLHYASRALYGQLLQAGVEIQEHHKSFLHAKVAVIDRRWATVGSSNIDPFSLLMSREANIVVRNVPFAEELRREVRRIIASRRQAAGARGLEEPLVRAQGRRLGRLRLCPLHHGRPGLRRRRSAALRRVADSPLDSMQITPMVF